MSDIFRRIGRGGAGNYISQKELEEAEKAHTNETPMVEVPTEVAEVDGIRIRIVAGLVSTTTTAACTTIE